MKLTASVTICVLFVYVSCWTHFMTSQQILLTYLLTQAPYSPRQLHARRKLSYNKVELYS